MGGKMGKLDRTLLVSSLVAIILATFHLAEDALRQPNSVSYPASVLILVVWLYGSVMMTGRSVGYLVCLLGGILASAMPFVHVVGSGGVIGGNSGGFAGFMSVWGLLLLGLVAALSTVLSARGLWLAFRGRRRQDTA